MILNLHGLFGHCENNNYRELQRLFPDEEIWSPQIDYLAEEPAALLDKLVEGGPYSLVVGNSLGGFFAYALGAVRGFTTVLTNPCVPPHAYLPGLAPDYRYLDEIEAIWNDAYPADFPCSVILGTRDELIDHERTLELLKEHSRIFTIDAMHRMSGPEYAASFQAACNAQ